MSRPLASLQTMPKSPGGLGSLKERDYRSIRPQYFGRPKVQPNLYNVSIHLFNCRLSFGQPEGIAHLNETPAFAATFAIPIPMAGHCAPGTMYFKTNTVIPPANPPAKLANPKNNTTLAFQATPLPL